MWDLPLTVEIDGVRHNIRNQCDYRVILDIFKVFNDVELTDEEKFKCAICIFYEDVEKITNWEVALQKMMYVLNCGRQDDSQEQNKPKVMDWEYDFSIVAPAIGRVLGYDIRTPGKYIHWWTVYGAYMEIGDCLFANVISIRSKRIKGKKLEDYERKFYEENKSLIDLPKTLTQEEQDWLDNG